MSDMSPVKTRIKGNISREEADTLLRVFRSDCLPFGDYPDYVLIEFLNKIYNED